MNALPALVSSFLAIASALPAQTAPPASGPAKSAAASDEAAFSSSFAALQKLGDSGKWSDEKSGLLKLLDDTGNRPFVQARRTEILDELCRAAIRTAVPQPDPAKLIEGKLLAWDRRTGDLSIRYGPGQWGDFKHDGDFWIHPASFEGPVRIKVSGDEFRFGDGIRPGSKGVPNDLNVLIGAHDDESIVAVISAHMELKGFASISGGCEILQRVGSRNTNLAAARQGPDFGKPFEIEVVLDAKEIVVNGRFGALCRTKAPEGVRGFVGVSDASRIKQLFLKGRATPSWLQGKLDAATHDAESAFLKTWKLENDVPRWLLEGAGKTTVSGTAGANGPRVRGDATLPWKLTVDQAKLYESLKADVLDGHAEKVIERIAGLEPGELPRDVVAYLTLEARDLLGTLSGAAWLLDDFRARNPDYIEGRFLHAKLQMERAAYDDAARELTEIQEKYFDPERLAGFLIQVDLLRGQPEEAQRILREARAAGETSSRFDEFDWIVVHVLRDPAFTRRFEEKSPHFALVTDIDKETARASLKTLEESYAICSKVFGASDAPPRPFPVYLFSGQAGYDEYAGVWSKMGHSTTGMYSPFFKHLMVWNLPNRGETARTLRHEVTHQYLDLLGYRVPVWFNEGLAEYVQFIASSSKADVNGDALDRAYVERLFDPKRSILRLEKFIGIGEAQFYDQAQIAYPEAWALVHFLRHGAAPEAATKEMPAPQEVNARLMGALAQRLAPDEVVRQAFAGVDLAAFQRLFVEHIMGLRAQVEKQ